MTSKEFYKRLKFDLMEHTLPEYRDIIKDLEIVSLEQVTGIFRSVMIRNNQLVEDNAKHLKELKNLCSILGISEKDL
jgi:hypothetical protein